MRKVLRMDVCDELLELVKSLLSVQLIVINIQRTKFEI